MEELYNKWQLQEKDLGNTEPYQFTKSELLDFAKYYKKNSDVDDVIKQNVLLAFTEKMKNIGLNPMDDAEKVVYNYLKANNSLIYCSPTEWRDVYFDD